MSKIIRKFIKMFNFKKEEAHRLDALQLHNHLFKDL